MKKPSKVLLIGAVAAVLTVSAGVGISYQVFTASAASTSADGTGATVQGAEDCGKPARADGQGQKKRGPEGRDNQGNPPPRDGKPEGGPRGGGGAGGAGGAGAGGAGAPVAPPASQPPDRTDSAASDPNAPAVAISGGFQPDPVDRGRPVVLIAAALGVPTEVFREAFSGVTPAGNGSPSSELAQRNKAALMSVLGPYGITNDRLDEVSNYYRYSESQGEMWRHTPASATATITDGVVTGITITNPGAGYTSDPTITIQTPNGPVRAVATIAYTQDFATNGSITGITLQL
ncbi:hypothetical protein [Paenibacillus koleovorans]|uniref:hypothetical protein n=1 Tax=Paenibacillus koleovorans TaxID=121608 RepID=UPI000FD91350|nr:hypothetical protein [Paenibacillus koleovorans]